MHIDLVSVKTQKRRKRPEFVIEYRTYTLHKVRNPVGKRHVYIIKKIHIANICLMPTVYKILHSAFFSFLQRYMSGF